MILGICGRARVGKDTLADLAVRSYGCTKVALADPLKRICQDVFDFSDDQLWGPSEERDKPDLRYPRYTDEELALAAQQDALPRGPRYLTPRYALQQLGTEWGRGCHPDVWVRRALRTAAELQVPGTAYSQKHGVMLATAGGPAFAGSRNVVISDVRFLNEVLAIRAAGGRVLRLTRPASGAEDQHVSESGQAALPPVLFEDVIRNDRDLDWFLAEARFALHRLLQ